MSYKNSQQNSHESRLDLIQNDQAKVKVIISQKLQNQISWLCNKIPNNEWSACLFYRIIEGEFGSDCTISAEQLFLLDIGSGVYTEHSYGPNFIRALMRYPELRTMLKGHIHSHNSMPVFFSSTDNKELIKNAPNHNFYFSLIVNNFNQMIARVAFKAKIEKTVTEVEKTFFKGLNGIVRSLLGKSKEDKKETEVIYYFECAIEPEKYTDELLEETFKEVADKKGFKDGRFPGDYVETESFEAYCRIAERDSAPAYTDEENNQPTLFDAPVEERKKRGPKGPWKHKHFEHSLDNRDDLTKKSYRFLVRLIKLDYASIDNLTSALTKINEELVDSKDLAFWATRISNSIKEYYVREFPEDALMADFESVLVTCQEILEDNYASLFPQIVQVLLDTFTNVEVEEPVEA